MKSQLTAALADHWPEYLGEALALGLFMLSVGTFGVLLEHPDSWAHRTVADRLVRRGFMGIAMGTTAVALIMSPWGKRSGAHMNPSVTLAFASLGKIAPWDALFYIAAQISGGILGMKLAAVLLGAPLGHLAVNYVVTVPGQSGWPAAFAAEFLISAVLMTLVLYVSNSRFSRWTPYCAGALVATYILLEAPISGMSMNPARTLGSAYAAHLYPALWIYFVGPPLGMLTAAQLFRARYGVQRVFCAKLHHDNPARCIFHCAFDQKG
jgi:aquaporin Z